MRLVLVTRKVDRGDALTGFVFGWIEALARNTEKLYVVCQEKGDLSGLPANVAVHSFGKERGYGKLRQSFALCTLSFRFARKSAGFFVHMHPIYAILTWPISKFFGKNVVLWYVHRSVDLKLRIAEKLVDRILTASPESFRIQSDKVKVVGHGIDLEKFFPAPSPLHEGEEGRGSKFKIVSIGRISPVKDYETLIKSIEMMVKQGQIQNIVAKIYGSIGLKNHAAYLDSLVHFVENAELEEIVHFEGPVSFDYVPQILREADVFVNLSQTGSIDKAVLEAAASEVLVLTSNEAFEIPIKKISPLLFFERNNPQDLAEKIVTIKSLPPLEAGRIRKQLRVWVEREHNLNNLVKKIIEEFQK